MTVHRIPVRRLFLVLAAAVVTATGLGAVAPAANAAPVGPCRDLSSFTLTFRTGGDDLRDNSEVIVWLTRTSGDVELQHVWGPFQNQTTNYRTVALTNPNWAVNSCSITGVRIRMVSHPGTFQSPDNWNMDAVTVQGYGAGSGSYSYYLSAVGNPLLKRFTNTDQFWSRLG